MALAAMKGLFRQPILECGGNAANHHSGGPMTTTEAGGFVETSNGGTSINFIDVDADVRVLEKRKPLVGSARRIPKDRVPQR
jgi:hypothetical protein